VLATLALAGVLGLFLPGCCGDKPFRACVDKHDCAVDPYLTRATKIEYPQVRQCNAAGTTWAAIRPPTLGDQDKPEYWNVTLEEVIQLSLVQSQVIRDLGGAMLRAPATVRTWWDPALIETNPRFGIEAALSAFDAQFSTSVFGEKNDKALNNQFFGGGTRLLQQDAAVFQTQITKRAATGTELAFRHNTEYDANNAPSNQFLSAWNVNLETEMRHPLLQGSGVLYNRIAGPTRVPGVYGGVLIARINTDVELAQFELAVRNLVSNLENAYWDLYFAYRDLDAKKAARDTSLETWRRIHALYQAGRRGGEAEKEAQAREQFFRFQEEVENGLVGRLFEGTRTDNGSRGGTFRASGGVHVTERRLRLLMGLPPSDGRLLRPQDEPVTAPIYFDWEDITRQSIVRRVELRRSRWRVRRRELEWIASRNHLLPRLDAVGRYRWRGFGNDLLNPDSSGKPPVDNAYANLTGGDFQEWQLGLELTMPIGYRRAFSAARHAQLQLNRSRALLREQEHYVVHDVADAVAEMDRARIVSQTTYNRLDAASAQLAAITAAYEADKAPLNLLLDGQRRHADAASRHYRALAEYAIAVKNVHFAKGTLLDYDGVLLSAGPWQAQAYRDAADKGRFRGRRVALNYASARAPIVSRGAYRQEADSGLPRMEFPVEPVGSPAESRQAELPAEPIPEPATGCVAAEKLSSPMKRIDTPPTAVFPPSPEQPGDAHIQTASFQTGDLIRLPTTVGDHGTAAIQPPHVAAGPTHSQPSTIP
jgi:outer membrane protein TolC